MRIAAIVLFGLHFLCVFGQSTYSTTTVQFSSKDGINVNADYYPTKDQAAPVIIMFHQSASSRGEYATIAPRLQVLGYNCLAVDLRWGKKDFWNAIENETGRNSGAYEVIDGYENTIEYRNTKVWPLMFASYNDMEASLAWAKAKHPTSKIIVWGSSFSAMLQFQLAANKPKQVNGMISYSPGEYYEEDTTMLAGWAVKTIIPVFIGAGKSDGELSMTQSVLDQLPNKQSSLYQSKTGGHGSSILITDEVNWKPLLKFLSQFSVSKQDQYLHYAIETAQWLENNTIDGAWPDAMDDPKTTNSLSDGMAGKVVFFLEMYAATNDQEYLDLAMQSGDYLLYNAITQTDSLKGKFWAFSPYGNVCGVGFALTELYKATNEEKYKRGALSIFDVVKHFAKESSDSISWDLGNDVLGGLSGTGLYLLYTAKELGVEEAKIMVKKAANSLIYRAITTNTTVNWKRGQNSKYVLPNFSHGAAGIGFFFAKLYEETKERNYLEIALKTNNYLETIAKTEGGVFLLPYGFPDPGWDRPYDIGWAHGPAGVIRFYRQLYKVTNDEKWLKRIEECVNGIVYSNVPFQPNPDFGEEVLGIDQRFGLAGVVDALVEETRLNRNDLAENYINLLASYIIDQSNHDKGRFWPQERFGFMNNAGAETVFTGYFYGNVGYGLMLLNIHYQHLGKQPSIRFMDGGY